MNPSHGRDLVTAGYGLDRSDLPDYDLERPESGLVDPREWFDAPDHPFEIEIGAGKGTFLVQQAMRRPEVNYLGIEWARAYYRYAADRVRRRELHNVRVLHADATEFIRHRCPDAVARVIHLYFSDPWPKKRHHKRRVLQSSTLDDFHRVLVADGELRLVTDHDDLWAWYEELAATHDHLFRRAPFAARDSASGGELVGTNYERKFKREGRPLNAMTLIRTGRESG
ncbi:MAG: tRNA (guanosine(46)-N7)-methyltransferase TrmB [Planctomycetes bacterium]|nr:tRNA (guanosine(46)-N7)-methyltransferase TrmB [Planctomycetota bacterium]